METGYKYSEIRLKGNKIFLKLFGPQNPVGKEAPSWDVTYWREEDCEKYSDSKSDSNFGDIICVSTLPLWPDLCLSTAAFYFIL